MSRLLFALTLLSCFLVAANNPGPYKASGRSSKVTIDAELYLDRTQVESLIGNSMDGYLVVVKVKVSSNRPAEAIRIFRDDFVLVSAKDGQRSEAFAPEMLAGSSTMVVSEVDTTAGGLMGQRNGPVWGGIPTGGPIPTSGPRRIEQPNDAGGGFGNATATTKTVTQEVRDSKGEGGDAAGKKTWIDVLQAKVLKDGELGQPIEGLLYFPLEGKHKPKQITLLYTGTVPKVEIEFSDK